MHLQHVNQRTNTMKRNEFKEPMNEGINEPVNIELESANMHCHTTTNNLIT